MPRMIADHVLARQARLSGRDFFWSRTRRGLVQGGLGSQRTSAGFRQLLWARALLQLLEVRLPLSELCMGLRQERRLLSRLECQQRLAGLHSVPLSDQHLLDAATHARTDRDRARLDGPAPLVGLAFEVHAVPAVTERKQRTH